MTTKKELPGADKGGVWVPMGDLQYKVAPLNFKALREMAPLLTVLQGVERGSMPTAEQIDALVSVAHASIKRNYPDITKAEVADALDFSNFSPVLGAVMGSSGLDKAKEDLAPGEVKPPE